MHNVLQFVVLLAVGAFTIVLLFVMDNLVFLVVLAVPVGIAAYGVIQLLAECETALNGKSCIPKSASQQCAYTGETIHLESENIRGSTSAH